MHAWEPSGQEKLGTVDGHGDALFELLVLQPCARSPGGYPAASDTGLPSGSAT